MSPAKPTHLWCQCKNNEKEWKGTSINLSKYILLRRYSLTNFIFLGCLLHLVSHNKHLPLTFPPLLHISWHLRAHSSAAHPPTSLNTSLHSLNYTALLFIFKP